MESLSLKSYVLNHRSRFISVVNISKRKYGCPDPLSIHKATAAINEGLTIRKAAQLYSIPKSTLYDHFSQRIEPGAVPGRGFATIIR